MDKISNLIHAFERLISIWGLTLLAPVIVLTFVWDYAKGKKKMLGLALDTAHTIKEEWHRILLLLAIGIWAFSKYYISKNEHYFNVFLEFFGALILFLIVENAVKKLKSGIEDPPKLPIGDFIKDIANANSELILFDTFLETILLDDSNCAEFKKSLKKVLKEHRSFSVRILLLSLDSPYVNERAKQRNMTEESHKSKMKLAEKILHDMKGQIEIEKEYYCDRIKIRKYKETPPFAMYSIDKKAYISFFPEKKKTTESRQLFIPNDSALGNEVYQFFYSRFDTIWERESF